MEPTHPPSQPETHHTSSFQNTLKKNIRFLLIALLILVLGVLLYRTYFHTPSAKMGDTVKVDYLGTLDNGKVFDTTLSEEAQKANVYNPQRTYEPFTFTLGAKQVVPGFEEAILGMKVGETKTVTLPPEKAYGAEKEELFLRGLKKEIRIPLTSDIPLKDYKTAFLKNPKEGETVENPHLPWKLKIISFNDTSVTLEVLAQKGDTVTIPGMSWQSSVKEIDNESLILIQEPKIGDKVSFPIQGRTLPGSVSAITDTTYDINLNPELAGKSLTFRITLKEITPS